MFSPLIFWIVVMVITAIVEIFTATFYVLCLSLGAFAIILFEIFYNSSIEGYFSSSVFFWEVILFAIISGVSMVFFPKMLATQNEIKTGNDKYLGSMVTVIENNTMLAIRLDGQLWRIENESDFSEGQSAKILAFEGTKVLLG